MLSQAQHRTRKEHHSSHNFRKKVADYRTTEASEPFSGLSAVVFYV